MTAVIEPTGEVRESEDLSARLQHTLHRHPAIGPASVLVVSVIVFTIINPRFINATNLSLLIQQVAVTGKVDRCRGVAESLEFRDRAAPAPCCVKPAVHQYKPHCSYSYLIAMGFTGEPTAPTILSGGAMS